jgi:hypothetical protein
MSVFPSDANSPSADEVPFPEVPSYPRVTRPRMQRHRINRLTFGPLDPGDCLVALLAQSGSTTTQESVGLGFDGARLA